MNHRGRGVAARAGSTLVPSLIIMTGLVAMTGAVMLMTGRTHKESASTLDGQKAMSVATSGLSHVISELVAGNSANLGDYDNPVELGGGSYFVSFIDNGEDVYTAVACGRVGREERAIQATFEIVAGGAFQSALFAGNSSEDPLYVLDFGGRGDQADEINGSVYSGGDIEIREDAELNDTIEAAGVIRGGTGLEGFRQDIPDIAGMNYESTADVDVAAAFDKDGVYVADDAGGEAWQLPESHPAHIFRKNPSDRWTATSSTAKDDYFLEDPYETVRVDTNQNGSDAYRITADNLNEAVLFIDGNLWLHNKKTYSLRFHHSFPHGLKLTVVVKGNIYFSDNIFYTNKIKDGVAFIAMKDEDEPDSGNIYLGDPEFGTLRRMEAFMYAENNFYDINLDASDSSRIEITGNMTAGNQVVIKRDFGLSHTKLLLNHDKRIATGDLSLPGLPEYSGGDGIQVHMIAWNTIAVPDRETAMALSRGDVDVFESIRSGFTEIDVKGNGK